MLFKKTMIVTGMMLMACGATVANADAAFEGGPQKGATSIALYGNLRITDSKVNGSVNGQVGTFASPSLEIGAVASIDYLAGKSTGAAGAFVNNYFGESRARPYVGLEVEGSFGSGSGTTIYGGKAGLLNFVAPQQAWFVEAAAVRTSGNGSHSTDTAINFGLKFFLK